MVTLLIVIYEYEWLANVQFRINRRAEDDWFDPILDADTELSVDPFLVFKETRGFWRRLHETIMERFDRALVTIARGNLNPDALVYKKALALLIFKESRELCLGYTSKGPQGLGAVPDTLKQLPMRSQRL
jgi:hypothetical protein